MNRFHLFFATIIFSCALAHAGDNAVPQPIAGVRDSYPQLSPDGRLIVFQSNRDGSNQIWLMHRDGSGLKQLTHAPGDGAETPVWSPDGQSIAYAAYLSEGNNDVFLMQADGSDQKQLTGGPGYDGHPHWSADGSQIIFNSDRATPDPEAPWNKRYHDIWSLELASGEERRLTDCRTVCTFGSLSPDGQTLLYRRVDDSTGLDWDLEAGERNSEIYIQPLAGGKARNLSNHPAFDGWPLWSPDGQWIVFASNRTGPVLTGQLWLIRPDGSELTQLTDGHWGHVQPSFSPVDATVLTYRYIETETFEFGQIVEIMPP